MLLVFFNEPYMRTFIWYVKNVRESSSCLYMSHWKNKHDWARIFILCRIWHMSPYDHHPRVTKKPSDMLSWINLVLVNYFDCNTNLITIHWFLGPVARRPSMDWYARSATANIWGGKDFFSWHLYRSDTCTGYISLITCLLLTNLLCS